MSRYKLTLRSRITHRTTDPAPQVGSDGHPVTYATAAEASEAAAAFVCPADQVAVPEPTAVER